MEWVTNSLSFVVFTIPKPGVFDAYQLWLKLFGVSPEQFQQHPQGIQFGGSASGKIGDYQIQTSAAPQRLDITLSPIVPVGPQPPVVPPSFKDRDSAFDALKLYGTKMLSEEGLNRIGFLAGMSFPTDDAQTAAQQFINRAPVHGLPDMATDLNLTVNVRRQTCIQNIEMNRLCRWATGVGQMVQMTFSGAAPLPTFHQTHAVLLNVDVNTAAKQMLPVVPPIKLADRTKLFDELAAETKEIMLHGYDRLARLD